MKCNKQINGDSHWFPRDERMPERKRKWRVAGRTEKRRFSNGRDSSSVITMEETMGKSQSLRTLLMV